MKAYSSDLRERVVRAVDQRYKRADIVKLFGVSRATIKRYLKQRRETGQVCRKPIPGRPPKKGASLQAGLVAQLEAYPDATLEMHCQFWEQTQGVRVSTSTMSRVIKRIGWTQKKKTLEPAGESSACTWTQSSLWSLMSVGPTLVSHRGMPVRQRECVPTAKFPAIVERIPL